MENGSSLLCDVILGFQSRTKQAQTERSVAFFFTRCLIRVLLLDVTTKMTQKIAELSTEYPLLTIIARSKWEEGKKWINFAISHCLRLFHGRMKPERTSQSKLDPFSLLSSMGPKSAQLPYFERVQHLKEKCWAKNLFAIVNMRKKFWALLAP